MWWTDLVLQVKNDFSQNQTGSVRPVSDCLMINLFWISAPAAVRLSVAPHRAPFIFLLLIEISLQLSRLLIKATWNNEAPVTTARPFPPTMTRQTLQSAAFHGFLQLLREKWWSQQKLQLITSVPAPHRTNHGAEGWLKTKTTFSSPPFCQELCSPPSPGSEQDTWNIMKHLHLLEGGEGRGSSSSSSHQADQFLWGKEQVLIWFNWSPGVFYRTSWWI